MEFAASQGLRELLLPPRCAGCGAPGVDWCEDCHRHLLTPARRIHTRVSTLYPVWSVAPYSGPVAAGLVEFKEHRRRQLAVPFGEALGRAAAGLVAAGEILHPAERPWVIVPAPSTEAAIRARGFHHMREVAETLAQYVHQPEGVELLGGGAGEMVVAELLWAAPHADAVGLTARQRRANVAGTIRCDSALLAQLNHWLRAEILVVDDITTTGATLAECFSALHQAGLHPRGALTLSAA